jgi:hypothetical protein
MVFLHSTSKRPQFAKALITVATMAFACCALASQSADSAKADLAKRLTIGVDQITVTKDDPATWPDTSLGLPQPGTFSGQVVTPGELIQLNAKGTEFLYTAAGSTVRFAGPVLLRNCSLLYRESLKNAATWLDLVQVSIVGTNPVTLAQQVESYESYPNGAILAVHPKSRSYVDLLYLAPGVKEPRRLTGGTGIWAYALDEQGKNWAAVACHTLGADRQIDYGLVGGAGAQSVAIPDGLLPSSLVWHAGDLFAETKKGWMSPLKKWAPTDDPTTGSLNPLMLNRSYTAKVQAVTVDGKSATQVCKVHFSGKSTVLATIEGFESERSELYMHRWVFLFGKQGEEGAVYIVDTSTGMVIPSILGGFSAPSLCSRPSPAPVQLKD